MQKINFKIEGTHCQSCKILIENEIKTLVGVINISVDYATGQSEVEFDSAQISKEQIFQSIEKLNYKVIENPPLQNSKKKSLPKRLIIAGILLFLFSAGFFLIKYFGLLNLLSKLNEKNLSYGLLFLIGFFASFHCIGMCGGLVITYTANHLAKNNGQSKSILPHFQYNLGRIISYSVIGGILGGIGSFFGINPTFTGIIILFAGIFMILMGVSLFTDSSWLKKIQIQMPGSIANFLFRQKHSQKPKGPLIIGLLNGFMPCGPLQAMQLYALSTGSVLSGALSMGVYALGTVPLMFGLGSFISLLSPQNVKQALKASGAIVVILGLLMINRGLINFGWGFSGLTITPPINQNVNSPKKNEGYQIVKMDLTNRGYSPNVLYIKKDIPVRWIINVKQMSGCTNKIILHGYNIEKSLKYGENIIEFTPKTSGEIKFSCWMQMVWGKFIVS